MVLYIFDITLLYLALSVVFDVMEREVDRPILQLEEDDSGPFSAGWGQLLLAGVAWWRSEMVLEVISREGKEDPVI